MLYFFAKLGRKSWAKNVLPTLSVAAGMVYSSYHFYGHNFVKEYLLANNGAGQPEELSPSLIGLINEVQKDLIDKLNKPVLDHPLWKHQELKLEWFSSTTLDPVVVGLADSRNGVMIGLPNYYNYEEAESLPSSLFELKAIKFFKTSDGKNKEFNDTNTRKNAASPYKVIASLNRDSPEGQEYIDSLLLSHRAKKFSIAREILKGHSYRPLYMLGIWLLSTALSLTLARGSILRLNLHQSNLGNRLPFYALSGFAGYWNFIILKDTAGNYIETTINTRAREVSQEYKEGEVEFFTKKERRDRILKDLEIGNYRPSG